MATLNINGRKVTVDDSFLQMSPEEQSATVEEIAASLPDMGQESQTSKDTRSELSALTQQAARGPDQGAINSFGRGLIEIPTFGFADEMGAGARWLGGKVLPWRSEVTYDQALDEVRGQDRQAAEDHPITNTAGTLTGAIGTGLGMARAGLSPTAAVASRGYGLPTITAASAVEGGLLAGAQGFGQGEGGVETRLNSARESAKVGALVGAALPGAISGLTSAARRVVTPASSSAARRGLVDTLRREGVEVSAGQATGNNTLRYAESEIGGQVAQDVMERQGEQFTNAVLRRAGVNANRATPEVIDQAFDRIGQQFDDLAARNAIQPDARLARDLGTNVREYFSLVPESQRAPVVMDVIGDVGTAMRKGALDGAAYQSLRSRLDRLARGSTDPQLSEALRGIRNSLDNAMERSIAIGNPRDLGAFRQARNQYRNMLVIEQAATGAGENAAAGIISPSALRNATVSKHGRRNYARGTGDFAELARAGEGVMKAMPQSGTAPRTAVRNLGAAIPTVLGASGGAATGGLPGALAGAAAGAALPQVVGRLMMSQAGQAYLRNQLMAGGLSPQTRAAVVSVINQIDANALPKLLGEESKVPSTAGAR